MERVKYQIHNSSFKIATRGVNSRWIYVYLLTDSYIFPTTYLYISLDDERCIYKIEHCTTYDLLLTNVPAETNKIWVITATEAHLNIKCNGVEVLHFVYDDSPDYECKREVKGKSVHEVFFSYDREITFSSAAGE